MHDLPNVHPHYTASVVTPVGKEQNYFFPHLTIAKGPLKISYIKMHNFNFLAYCRPDIESILRILKFSQTQFYHRIHYAKTLIHGSILILKGFGEHTLLVIILASEENIWTRFPLLQ